MGWSRAAFVVSAGAIGASALLLATGAWAQDDAAMASDTIASRLRDGTPMEQFQTALDQIDALKVYNDQMRSLISAQQAELASLDKQVSRVKIVEKGVPMLMGNMINSLEKFVELDIPFDLEERQKRITELRKVMLKADVNDAERYRRIMEAYTIENEYGRTIDAYRGSLKQGGSELTVDFLRFGRVALIYQTLDQSEAGTWNQATRSWDPVSDDYATSIRNALRIARKQAAPDMVLLPLPAAGGSS